MLEPYSQFRSDGPMFSTCCRFTVTRNSSCSVICMKLGNETLAWESVGFYVNYI